MIDFILRIMGGRPSITAILKAAKAKCEKCKTSKNLTVNHKTPLANGGTNEAENLEIVCRKCHDRYHGIIPKKKLR